MISEMFNEWNFMIEVLHLKISHHCVYELLASLLLLTLLLI